MPYYRKRPVIVYAEQFFPDIKPWPKGVYRKESAGVDNKFNENVHYCIDTLEGSMSVFVGSYIITGVLGEKYAVRPDVFERSYELSSKPLHPNAGMHGGINGGINGRTNGSRMHKILQENYGSDYLPPDPDEGQG